MSTVNFTEELLGTLGQLAASRFGVDDMEKKFTLSAEEENDLRYAKILKDSEGVTSTDGRSMEDVAAEQRAMRGEGFNYAVKDTAPGAYKKQKNLPTVAEGASVFGKSLADTPEEEQRTLSSERQMYQQILNSSKSSPGAKAAAKKSLEAMADMPMTTTNTGITSSQTQEMTPQTLKELTTTPGVQQDVKNNAIIEAMLNPEMSKVLADRIKGTLSQTDKVIAQLESSFGATEAIRREDQMLSYRNAELLNQQLRAKADLENRTAADTYGILSRSGIDLTNPESLVNQAVVANAADYQELLKVQRELSAQRQINFLEDPAGWLLAQFSEGDTVDKHNALEKQIATRTAYVQTQSQAISAAKNANAGKLSTMSVDAVAAESERNFIAAQRDMLKSQIAQAEAQGKSAVEILKLQRDTTATLTAEQFKAMQMVEQEQRQQLIDDARKEGLEAKRRDAAAKQKTEEEKKAQDKLVADALAPAGIPVTTVEQLNRLPAKQKEIALKVLGRLNQNSLGETPIDVLELTEFVGNRPAGNDSQKILLRTMQVTAEEEKQKLANQPIKKDAMEAAVNRAIRNKFVAFQENYDNHVKASDVKWNPYAPVPIEKALPWLPASNQFVKSAALVQAILPKDGSIPLTAQLIIQKMSADGITPDKIAAAVVEYAKKQIEANNKTANFTKFAVPEQTTLFANLGLGGSKVNLADTNAVAMAIVKMQILSIARPEVFSITGE